MERTCYRATWPGGLTIIWRSLTYKEYRRIAGMAAHPWAKYAEVYKTALLDGLHLEYVPAGVAHWIGKYELENNPFSGNLKQIQLQQARSRAKATEYMSAARAMVAWAFRYSFEEMDEWDAEVFFNRVAQAEWLFNRPIDLEDKNNPQQAQPPPKKGAKKFGAPRPSRPVPVSS